MIGRTGPAVPVVPPLVVPLVLLELVVPEVLALVVDPPLEEDDVVPELVVPLEDDELVVPPVVVVAAPPVVVVEAPVVVVPPSVSGVLEHAAPKTVSRAIPRSCRLPDMVFPLLRRDGRVPGLMTRLQYLVVPAGFVTLLCLIGDTACHMSIPLTWSCVSP
jgi:hypothetical protein